MLPIISIVGKSNSGKTQLLENLVAQLKEKGFRIATIKHSRGFDLEAKGKDSWRLAKAGSSVVMLSSPQRLALIEPLDHELNLEELRYRLLGHLDIIFTEGYKKAGAVKIEVHRREQGADLVTSPAELFALVTDEPLDISVPQYAANDVAQLADKIEESFLHNSPQDEDTELFINGLPVPIKPYVQDIFSRVVIAMASTLRGVDIEKIQQVDVRLRRG